MSANKKIIEDIKTFLDDNEKCTKKEFVSACGAAFDEHKKSKGKKTKNAEEMPKKSAKKDEVDEDGEEKPKKELTGYQKFVKEQMPILKAREDEKDDGETKKKASELMKEIGELWKAEKNK